MQQASKSEFLMTSEAGQVLHVTPATVRYLEKTGKLHAQRTASGVRIFAKAEVERLRKEREAKRA